MHMLAIYWKAFIMLVTCYLLKGIYYDCDLLSTKEGIYYACDLLSTKDNIYYKICYLMKIAWSVYYI